MRMTTDIPVLLPWWCVSGSRFLEPHREPAALSAESLQHRPCLLELLDQAVYVLHRGPAAARDALAAAPVEDLRLLALLPRHRLDDRLRAAQILVADRRPRRQLHAREHLHQLVQRTELLHLLELPQEILEAEPLLAELLLEGIRLRVVQPLLRALDQRQHVPHAQDAGGEPIRVKGLERLDFLSDAQIPDGYLAHGPERERGTASRVAVHLRQEEARHAEPLRERLGDLDRVLAGHAVQDQER